MHINSANPFWFLLFCTLTKKNTSHSLKISRGKKSDGNWKEFFVTVSGWKLSWHCSQNTLFCRLSVWFRGMEVPSVSLCVMDSLTFYFHLTTACPWNLPKLMCLKWSTEFSTQMFLLLEHVFLIAHCNVSLNPKTIPPNKTFVWYWELTGRFQFPISIISNYRKKFYYYN